jgi:ribosomal protein S18 acetylase RimI-like enzyme
MITTSPAAISFLVPLSFEHTKFISHHAKADGDRKSSVILVEMEGEKKEIAVTSVEEAETSTIEYLDYVDESNLSEIQALVSKDLSEPYSIFTYRYFLHNWPRLCICAYATRKKNFEADNLTTTTDTTIVTEKEMIGTIVCKADEEHGVMKGYIAMLTVNNLYRKKGIGSYLARLGIQRMIETGCQEIVLETEVPLVCLSPAHLNIRSRTREQSHSMKSLVFFVKRDWPG